MTHAPRKVIVINVPTQAPLQRGHGAGHRLRRASERARRSREAAPVATASEDAATARAGPWQLPDYSIEWNSLSDRAPLCMCAAGP